MDRSVPVYFRVSMRYICPRPMRTRGGCRNRMHVSSQVSVHYRIDGIRFDACTALVTNDDNCYSGAIDKFSVFVWGPFDTAG